MTASPESVRMVEGYLRELAWPITTLSPGMWRSSFRGRTSVFPLVIHADETWCRMMVLPIVRLPSDLEKAENLYEKLLRLNGEILLARFSLDEDGDVVLSVEFPLTDLDASELKDALDVLSFYAGKHQGDLRRLVA